MSRPRCHGNVLSVIGRGTSCLLRLVGRLLSFEGLSTGTRALGYGRSGVLVVLDRVFRSFSPVTRGQGVDCDLATPRRSMFVSFSCSGVHGVYAGVLSGTFGFAPGGKDVSLSVTMENAGLRLAFASANYNVRSRTGRGVFREFCRSNGGRSGGKNDNVKLRVISRCMGVRRNAIYIESGRPYNSMFLVTLPLRRGDGRAGGKRPIRKPRVGRRSRPFAVLLMSSGCSFLGFLSRDLTERCRMLGTAGKGRTLGMLRGRSVSLIIDSVVVPRVSNLRLYSAVGGSVHCSRVPVVLLATGTDRRRRLRKLDINTSSCVAGPFGVRILGLHVGGVVRVGIGHRRVFGRSVGVRPDHVAVAPLSRRLIRGTVRVMRSGVDRARFSIRRLTDDLGVSHDCFCGGVVGVAKGGPVRFVEAVHVGHTRRLLARDRVRISRVTCALKCGSPGVFSGRFGRRFGVDPSRFVERRTR